MLQVNLSEIKRQYVLNNSYDWEQRWKSLLAQLKKKKATKKMFPLENILDACGFDDAVTALEAVKGYQNAIRLFACYCARRAIPLFEKRFPGDFRLRAAIDVAEQYARGLVTRDKLDAARKSLRDLHKDLWQNKDMTNYIMEELYEAINPVATCVNGYGYKYTARRDLDLAQVSSIANTSAYAVSYFIRDVVSKENKEANAALNDEDPSKGLFKAFYTLPDFDTASETILDAAAEAIEVIAGDTVSTLEQINIHMPLLPLLENIKDAASNAIWNTVINGVVVGGICNSIVNAVKDDFAHEFRRLCRLEGEYGEVEVTLC